ncbi:MAG: hypothetical protein GY838_18400 [bacterium]|nr:hypothetical protein [bacterium]
MRTLLLFLACSLFLPASASAALPLAVCETTIGLYVAESPSEYEDAFLDAPAGGLHTVYLVCGEPQTDDGTAISTLGGFECELTISGGWSFQSVVLPPNVLDLDTNVEAFYCSGLLPVSGDFVTLATMSLLNYSPTKGWVWIAPYGPAPSIPGHMAITDAENGFDLAEAAPSSGDYERPVFGINQGAEKEDQTWSGVKVLFQ